MWQACVVIPCSQRLHPTPQTANPNARTLNGNAGDGSVPVPSDEATAKNCCAVLAADAGTCPLEGEVCKALTHTRSHCICTHARMIYVYTRTHTHILSHTRTHTYTHDVCTLYIYDIYVYIYVCIYKMYLSRARTHSLSVGVQHLASMHVVDRACLTHMHIKRNQHTHQKRQKRPAYIHKCM